MNIQKCKYVINQCEKVHNAQGNSAKNLKGQVTEEEIQMVKKRSKECNIAIIKETWMKTMRSHFLF